MTLGGGGATQHIRRERLVAEKSDMTKIPLFGSGSSEKIGTKGAEVTGLRAKRIKKLKKGNRGEKNDQGRENNGVDQSSIPHGCRKKDGAVIGKKKGTMNLKRQGHLIATQSQKSPLHSGHL